MEEDFQLAAALHLLQLRESPPPQFDTDFAFAVSLFAEDLENIDVSYSDHRIAKLYQNAQSTSGRLISQFSAVEAFESSDHDFAARLSRGTCQLDEPKSPVTLDDENLSKGIQESPLIEQWGLETLEPAFGSLGHDEFEFYTPQTMGGPSNRHYTDTFTRGPDNGTDHHNNADNRFCHSSLKLKPPVRFNLIEKRAQSFGLRYSAVDHCVACDSVCPCYVLACNHPYCEQCARSTCLGALNDRSFAPVRCCKIEFPILLVKHMLFGESWEKYQTILNEINSPPAPPSEVVLDKAVEELALLKRWKRCPGCQALIERKEGCVHMTCSYCRHEFCMTCLAKWHQCRCELFPEEELERILDARLRPTAPQAARARLRGVMQNYYAHEHGWEYRRGGQNCRDCGWTTDYFYLHCSGCLESLCRRCMQNR